jgi:serralysin
LSGLDGHDRLEGGGGDDVLIDGKGHDTLSGGDGADTLYISLGDDNEVLMGGAGDDRYVVRSRFGQVTIVEAAGEGQDVVFFDGYSLVLGSAEVEVVIADEGAEARQIWGSDVANRIVGSGSDNAITGFGGDDTLIGFGGFDTLDGSEGNDVLVGEGHLTDMRGGTGNDIYIVKSGGAGILEHEGCGTVDWVRAGNHLDLSNGGEIELLTTTNRRGTDWIDLRGSYSANKIIGNGGRNHLEGGYGDDTLLGGSGNDRLDGEDDADALFGGEGDDRLSGGYAADRLIGGSGRDTFVFDAAFDPKNRDRVIDFAVGDDRIALDATVFYAIGSTGRLSADAFVIGARAQDAEDRITYNAATGALLYDADGNGADTAARFATLAAGLDISHANFVVI